MLHAPMQLWGWVFRQYREVFYPGYLVVASLGRGDNARLSREVYRVEETRRLYLKLELCGLLCGSQR
jgi:hypothetical protein